MKYPSCDDGRSFWFNFRVGEHQYIDTPEDFTDYIPQIPAAQSMYRLLLVMGELPICAAIRVPTASVGEAMPTEEAQ